MATVVGFYGKPKSRKKNLGQEEQLGFWMYLMQWKSLLYGKPKSWKKLGSRGAAWILNVFDAVKKFAKTENVDERAFER
jgi:hypothetical protein